MRYLEGDTNTDGTLVLPYDDEIMEYKNGRYVLLSKGLVEKYDINLDDVYPEKGAKGITRFLDQQSRNVYRELLRNYGEPVVGRHKEIVEFKIARKLGYREVIENALVSQVEWVINFDKDLMEEGISPNAVADLQELKLWHKGTYSYCVDPDELGVGY